MPKPSIGMFNAPQSLRQLTRGRGWNSELTGFLLPFARQDYVYWEDDFLSDTLSTVYWAVASTAAATSITDFAQGSLESGTLRGDTGTDDNAQIAIYFTGGATGPLFDAARNPGTEIRFKTDVITSWDCEIAFTDPKTDEALTACDPDAPVAENGVTDFAGLVLDTDDTIKTFVVAGYGTTDTTGVAVSAGAFMPVAATYSTYLVQAGANKVFGIIDNNFAYSGYTQALAVSPVGPDTGILMRPSYIFGSRVASAQKTIDIDYIRIWAERY